MQIDYWHVLSLTQEHITRNYAGALDRDKLPQLKPYIQKYLRDNDYEVKDFSFETLTDALYSDMAEFSVLTSYLSSTDLEEINLNAWDDIAITKVDGSVVKTNDSFRDSKHSLDVVRRLLHTSGMIIDDSKPMAQGHLPSPDTGKLAMNTRVTALKSPIVDEEIGVAASIRLLNSKEITRELLLRTEFATEEMLDFLIACIRYGASVVVAGATSTGKTSLINYLLSEIPNEKRIFTIESGARELSLVKKVDGKTVNNVVHTLSKPSENYAFNISQEKLVVASLRFNPDIVVIGEMRDTEAYSAVEASLTGHTVVSTVHSAATDAAHMRISLLCQKKFPIDFNTSLTQTAHAFPIIVFCHRMENNDRKIMDISEAVVEKDGSRSYRTLWNYEITENTVIGDKYLIKGGFHKKQRISDGMIRRLVQYGIPQNTLKRFTEG